jgi:hypothetical protein
MARLRRKLICRAACPIQKRTETFLRPCRIRIDHTARSTFLTYDDQIETAIADQDIDRLIRFAYGYTCRCTTVKGEPMCVCKMRRHFAPKLFHVHFSKTGLSELPKPNG